MVIVHLSNCDYYNVLQMLQGGLGDLNVKHDADIQHLNQTKCKLLYMQLDIVGWDKGITFTERITA